MAKKPTAPDNDRLLSLIEEATVDCYNDIIDEHTGIVTMIEENVVCPFKAKAIGEAVEVIKLIAPKSGTGLDAVCRVKGKEYRVDIGSLEWPKKKPDGFEWIEAFLLWQSTLN